MKIREVVAILALCATAFGVAYFISEGRRYDVVAVGAGNRAAQWLTSTGAMVRVDSYRNFSEGCECSEGCRHFFLGEEIRLAIYKIRVCPEMLGSYRAGRKRNFRFYLL